MIYLALAFWLFLVILAGIGVYRMLGRLARPRWVDWALLPGTLVSEMAYILGCLITGGEIRRARLIRNDSAAGRRGGGPAGTDAVPRLKVVGPIVAALTAIVACMGAIVAVHALLGEPILKDFLAKEVWLLGPVAPASTLPKALPTTWNGFWADLNGQIDLLRRMSETWAGADWLDWRVPLFIYLALCLSIRLAPVTRPVRPTLGAALAVSAVIALAAMVSSTFAGLIDDVWPLLTYVWTSLLLLLVLSLLIRGAVGLVRILSGKQSK